MWISFKLENKQSMNQFIKETIDFQTAENTSKVLNCSMKRFFHSELKEQSYTLQFFYVISYLKSQCLVTIRSREGEFDFYLVSSLIILLSCWIYALCYRITALGVILANIYMFKVNSSNINKSCEICSQLNKMRQICSKLTIKAPE